MAKSKIKTYSTETFRNQFMKPERQLEGLMKADYGKFFIVRVEEMLSLIKLPVPPVRSTIHIFIYLTKGEAIMTIGSETFTIPKDECLIVPAGQVFSFSHHDINKGYICGFHDDFIVGKFGKNDLLKTFEFLNVWGNPNIKFGKQTSGFVLQLLKRIFEDYSKYGLRNIDLIQSYFIALLCEINHVYTPVSNGKQAQYVRLANRFKELVFLNKKTKHLVSDYASLLNISPNHLNKVVKQVTGKSPTKWIAETLVMEAKVLLYQTDFSINEIASEIGIYDQSYFSRLFKKYEGVTPLVFRKMITLS